MSKKLYDVLYERGYIYQLTHKNEIIEFLNSKEKKTFYLGIDPTADSLHIGHFFALMMFRYLQDAGHRGIIVIGGATALIGDPSGKSNMRKILTHEEVEHNLKEVKQIVEKFVKIDGDNPAIILNNGDWINQYGYVDFMRDIGIHFNVNTMLQTDSYANRLSEGGLTFLEMGYMLMQAYDFSYLKDKYDCSLQIGGSDQWGNIVAGINLNRKLKNITSNKNELIFGLTCPLLTTKEGNKMGKTEKGALWIASDKTTVFDFYQYFYNVMDEDTETLLRLFTRLPLNDIYQLCEKDIVKAKRTMAYEITKLVHGLEEADKVLDAINSLYNSNSKSENIPTYQLNTSNIENGISLIELLVSIDFASSNSEARRLIQQGGISINSSKIINTKHIVNLKDLDSNEFVLKKGKKKFVKVIF